MPELLGITVVSVMVTVSFPALSILNNNNAKRNFASLTLYTFKIRAPYECVKQRKAFDGCEEGRNLRRSFSVAGDWPFSRTRLFKLLNLSNILTQSSVRIIIALGVAGLIVTRGQTCRRGVR